MTVVGAEDSGEQPGSRFDVTLGLGFGGFQAWPLGGLVGWGQAKTSVGRDGENGPLWVGNVTQPLELFPCLQSQLWLGPQSPPAQA